MKNPKLLIALFLGFAASASAKQPTEAELDDWMLYIKSVGLPSTVEICGVILKTDVQLKADSATWLETNKDAIERGHAFTVANHPKNGKSLDEYNAAMVEDFKVKFGKQPEEFKTSWCQKYAGSLDKKQIN
jgi:hypothetical protein